MSIPDKEDYVQHTFSVYGEDVVGNRTEPPLEVSVIVDNVAPVITVTEAVTQVWWGSTETILSGTVSDGGQVSTAFVYIQDPTGRIYSDLVTREGDTWQYDLRAWLVGSYTLWVTVGDLAGNVSTAGPYAVDATCIAAQLSAALVTAEPTAGTPFSVTLTVVVSNTGNVEIPAGLPVGFYVGDMRIGAATTAQALGLGQAETMVVTWENSYRGDHAIRIVPNDVETGVSPLHICAMQATAQQTLSILDVPLVESWNLVSTYVNPFNTDASVVQRPIEGQYVVIQGFDSGAPQSYYPDLPPGVNTLKDMDAEHGYWIKATADQAGEAGATLQVVGEKLAEDRPIEMDAGWSLVSYLPRQPQAVPEALQSIDGQYTVVLGYDQGALSYYPDIDPSFNTLNEMTPLFGYWIKMAQAGTLQYPTTLELGSLGTGEQRSKEGDQVLDIRGAERAAGVTPTQAWVNFYGTAHRQNGTPLPVGTRVLALDPDDVVCGATVITHGGRYGLLACYGDDPTTTEDEGAMPGDTIRLMVDGQTLGTGTWTAHADRQWSPLGSAPQWQVWLPLIRK